MENKLEYSFDDEPISMFCYDLDNKKIEVHFKGYYDLIKDVYIEAPCIWVLENWEYAKSRIGDEQTLCDLNKQIGIFSLILYMKFNNNKELEMLVNTVDNRYFTLFFKNPQLSLR
jgi:hypothetical protein